MHIHSYNHKARQQDTKVAGLTDAGTTIQVATATGPLAFDPNATGLVTGGVPLVEGTTPVLTASATSAPSATPSASATPTAEAAQSHQLPVGIVIGACVAAFFGLALLVVLFWAGCKRNSDKMNAAARRNAEGHADQRRERSRSFNRLQESEKPNGGVPPPALSAREMQESDEKNFSMFKKSPSIRTAYTHKTMDEENTFDLPQLEFTKYHATLAQELSLEDPQKPFATAAAAVRQNSGVSWDGETVADDSFLSMHSVRVESGTMSPTLGLAKMTPPATANQLHKWESAEVLNAEEDEANMSRNPFADMTEERKARTTNPFFNAQETHRQSRAIRSRSNSRTSRTSRAQSLVRSDPRSNTNPFIDMQGNSTIEMPVPETFNALPTKPAIAHTSSTPSVGSDRAMASLIAALDLTKEQVEERLRVVSMQGSTISAYSEDDALTVRNFPMPPGTTAPRTP